MNFLQQLKIGPRLALGFGAILAIAAAVVLIGISRLGTLDDSLIQIKNDRVPKINQLSQMGDNTGLAARELRNAVIQEDSVKVNAALDAAAKARDDNGKILEALVPTIRSAEGRKLLETLSAARSAYLPILAEYSSLVRAGKKADAIALLDTKLGPAQLALIKAIDALNDFQIAQINAAADEGGAMFKSARLLLLGLLAGMALVGCAFGWLISRSITQPISQAVLIAEKVAAGDLSSTIEAGNSRDETGQLLTALKTMNAELVRIVSTVRASSDSIATGSSQIATGNSDLSQRTEEQASNLQQTAASMEQLSSTVRNSADTARQASQLASSASSAATRGGEVVGQVVSTMNDITASSNRISDIIGVIDGIAFQTNILALNAAVEAARAGEQGRGFAVVASEVRVLAQRSADAAKEIKQLIGASAEKVEAGSRLVGDAGASMNDIVLQVKRVADLIGEISAAAVEQTSGIGQVTHAVTQLDQVTQQNAALVEESAAAAGSLSEQAARLVEAVSTFRLSHGAAVQTIARAQASSHAAIKPAAPRLVPAANAPAPASKTPASKTPASKPAASAATPKPAAPAGGAFKTPANPMPKQESKGGDDDWVSF